MKKSIRFLLVFAAMLSLGACSEKETLSDDAQMQAIAAEFVDGVVIPTYTQLANSSNELVEALKTLKTSRTDANVETACQLFLECRGWWEKSEAFLFGPASDFGIDPHIDSWPLDEDGFLTLMSNEAMLQHLEGEGGDVYAGDYLGNALLGFHGIEYILFEAGHAKPAASIPDKHMTYAVAVAGDLRNRCYQLEVSWAGAKAAASHRQVVEDLELNCTLGGSGFSYGDNMLRAGEAGSTYSSWSAALQAIIYGCKVIADEVGTSKIGKAHYGEDVTYIESPYSHQSLRDFADNMRSVQQVYHCGFQSLIGQRDPDLNAQVEAAIEHSIAVIESMPGPFVETYAQPIFDQAVEACQAVDEVLSEVVTELTR